MKETEHPMSPESPADRETQVHVLKRLADEDLDMVLNLVLASGSLKELARRYQVSYPTIRGRLDKLIDRLQALVADRPLDPMADQLAKLVERGELSLEGAKATLALHREVLDRDGKR